MLVHRLALRARKLQHPFTFETRQLCTEGMDVVGAVLGFDAGRGVAWGHNGIIADQHRHRTP
jgi:hypothetical protein